MRVTWAVVPLGHALPVPPVDDAVEDGAAQQVHHHLTDRYIHRYIDRYIYRYIDRYI
jgi:hypothetical protein